MPAVDRGGFKVLYNPELEICHREGRFPRLVARISGDKVAAPEVGQRIQALTAHKISDLSLMSTQYKNSITIIRDDGIGDLLMGMSAFKKLKSRYPEKKLILLTYQRNIEMMSGFKIFDEFLPIPNRGNICPTANTHRFAELQFY